MLKIKKPSQILVLRRLLFIYKNVEEDSEGRRKVNLNFVVKIL